MDSRSSGENSSSLVYQFQLARLNEWIGDLETANDIYEELKKENVNKHTSLAYILEPVVRERKKRIEDTQNYKNWGGKVAAETISQIDFGNELVQLYDSNKITPRSSFSERALPLNVTWKYSVTIAARVDNDLRLEIKGFCPDNLLPKFTVERLLETDWWICTIKGDIISDDPDQIMIDGESKLFSSPISLSVDRWGLLSGATLVREEMLGDYLIHIHELLGKLSSTIWVRK